MSNPRLEEIREEIRGYYADEETLREYELLLELEFLKKLAYGESN